jgi:hypothetical protein
MAGAAHNVLNRQERDVEMEENSRWRIIWSCQEVAFREGA